jgi:hypothetical protein
MSEQKYFDDEGNETSLYKLVRQSPDWARSRIAYMTPRIKELEAIAEKCGYPQEDGVEWYPLRRVRELEAEIEEVHLTGGCSYIRLNKAETRIKELQAKLDAVTEELSLAERYIPSFDRKMYQQRKRAIGEQE